MANELALSDIKILDFMWVMAGPASTRILADYGATVLRIESPTRIDVARTLHPHHDNQSAPDSSGLFSNCNAGKLGLSLDLGNPAAREVVHDLVRWAGVVTESFSPKAMRRWGFDYESLKKVKPDIIMLSTCLFGQTGPLSSIAGFGTMAAAISGFHNLTGWSDRAPCGVFGAYTDYISPRFTACAILAAVEHRRQTGEGQYIDQSQAEASTHFLGPAILDFSANGRNQERMGNADLQYAPHGVYPAKGEDRWVAIVCKTDGEWRALCSLMKRNDLVNDARFVTAAGRLQHRDELDGAVGEWTATLDAEEAEHLLQSRGIAAHQVQNASECYRDAQLLHRGHFVDVEHPTYDKTTVEGPRAVLSRTPAKVMRRAPMLGEHNEYILKEILGYDDEKIATLAATGVLG